MALRGGVSGGTLASMMGQQAEVRASEQRRRVVADPYALSPDRAAEPDLGDERDPGRALDTGQLPDRAGVLTPATAMGAALATRLRSAGHTLTTRQITQLPRLTPMS